MNLANLKNENKWCIISIFIIKSHAIQVLSLTKSHKESVFAMQSGSEAIEADKQC